MWHVFRSLKMQNAKGFSLRKDRNAQVSVFDSHRMSARCRGIPRHNQMRMSGTQSPTRCRFEDRPRKLAIAPRSNHFGHASRGVQQSDGSGSRRKYFGSKTQSAGKHFVTADAALKKLAHLCQHGRALRPLPEFGHHSLVLLIEFLAGEILL